MFITQVFVEKDTLKDHDKVTVPPNLNLKQYTNYLRSDPSESLSRRSEYGLRRFFRPRYED